MGHTLITVGWREWIRLPELDGDWLKAKIDTGARSSSLHAFDITPFDKDGEAWVRFRMHPKTAPVEALLIDTRPVKSSSGVAEVRPVIRTRLLLGSMARDVEVTLTRRDEMGFPMLVGREALRGRVVVHSGRSFLTGDCSQGQLRQPLAIGGVNVPAGQRERVPLAVGPLPIGREAELPVHVLHGAKDGPTVWINAATRGEEVGGIEIVRRVLEQVDVATLRGTILAVPVLNSQGLTNENRQAPDGRDLSRGFPGSAQGSITRRLAHLMLTEVVSRCTAGIDLRAGADGYRHLPQIRADLSDPQTASLALGFGAPIVLNREPDRGSLQSAASRTGASVLVYEGGESRCFSPAAIETGLRGVLRVLGELDMIDPVAPPESPSPVADGQSLVRASRTGLLGLEATLGQAVTRGQTLGRIHDASGTRLGRCRSRVDGVLIGLRRDPLVHRGDVLFLIAPTKDRP